MRRGLLAACLSACLAAALAGACAETPQTYRDLDKLGRAYAQDVSREPTAPPQSAEEATARDTCGAARFRSLIGAPAAGIDRASLPAGARIISPGQMVTMDFSSSRLNIRVGPDGKVAALECF